MTESTDRPAKTRSRRPTIRDVAERAGVSKSLVSLVLRESPKVSDSSRAAVMQAIQELGYRPSATARSLVSGHTGLLGLITPSALDVFFFEVIEGVSGHLRSERIELIPLILQGTRLEESEAQAAEQFLELNVEALMLMGSALSEERIEHFASEVPLVLVGRWMESQMLDVVVGDDTRGGQMAGRHLLDLGHRRVAHITGGSENGAVEREAGFRAAMAEAGCEPVVVAGSYTLEGGREGALALLDLPGEPPTAVFAANDLCALGAIDALRAAGHRVPEDISVMGYDDIALAGLQGIELTTINQPTRQIGETAARMVAQRVTEGRQEGQHVLIEPALVIRSSTRAA